MNKDGGKRQPLRYLRLVCLIIKSSTNKPEIKLAETLLSGNERKFMLGPLRILNLNSGNCVGNKFNLTG